MLRGTARRCKLWKGLQSTPQELAGGLKCRHARSTVRHRRAGRSQRGHGVAGAQRQARRVAPETRQAVLDGPRRARLRAPRPAAHAQRRPGRAGGAGAGQPDLPRVRPGHRDRRWRSAVTRRCCAPRPPAACTEDEYVEMLLDRRSPASCSSPACTPTPPADHDRYQRCVDRGDADRADQRVRGRASTPRSSPPTTRRPPSSACRHLVALGHRRIGLAIGPERFVPVQRKRGRLPRRHEPTRSASPMPTGPLVERRCSRSRAARRRPRRAARPGRHRDRLRLRHDGARRDPGGPRARAGGARRRLRGRLRRLAADGVHRPAADDHAPAGHARWRWPPSGRCVDEINGYGRSRTELGVPPRARRARLDRGRDRELTCGCAPQLCAVLYRLRSALDARPVVSGNARLCSSRSEASLSR